MDAHSEMGVKALEWSPLLFPIDTATARTAFGWYRVGEREQGGEYYWLFEGEKRRTGYASEPDAKSAAQADFAQRVQSCLTELLPCPFCGSDDIEADECETQFICNGCGASSCDEPTRALAIESWNRRTPR